MDGMNETRGVKKKVNKSFLSFFQICELTILQFFYFWHLVNFLQFSQGKQSPGLMTSVGEGGGGNNPTGRW